MCRNYYGSSSTSTTYRYRYDTVRTTQGPAWSILIVYRRPRAGSLGWINNLVFPCFIILLINKYTGTGTIVVWSYSISFCI